MSGVDTWTVTIPGTPRPQGSAKWVVSRTTGKPVGLKARTEVSHRQAMVARLYSEMKRGRRDTLAGPVELRVLFAIPRPKSHHTKTGALVHSAPLLHYYKPDTDKLIRLAGDALTQAGVIEDDAQICLITAEKRWLPHTAEGFTRLTLRSIDVLEPTQPETP